MGMRAVIADDEVLIRMYIREILENNGYEIAGEAEDGMDAVTVCREQAVDLDVMGYVVKPVDEDTLIPAVRIAEKKYLQLEEIRQEYNKTKETLSDRKYVDRAKGLIMERRNMTEKEAFSYIRKLSMDKGKTMAETAKILLKAYGE